MQAQALDLSSVSIDPNEIQQFEQSYETWVQNLAQKIVPLQRPTVLVEMAYTQTPERLQSYSELKATKHLPGLPEVMDPHLSHPSESPVAALLQSRRIKVIFEKSLTSTQERVLAEVLNSKLRINSNLGDQLLVSMPESAPLTAPQGTKDPIFILNLLLGALILAALLVRTRQQRGAAKQELNLTSTTAIRKIATQTEERAATPSPPPIKTFKFGDQDRAVMTRMMNADPNLLSKTSSIVTPTLIILKSDPKAMIRVIRSESVAHLTQAIHGSSILFKKTLLAICTSKQRNEIRELAKTKQFKKEDVLFAQNLLAAKIHRELQTLAVLSVDTYVKSQESVKSEKKLMTTFRSSLAQATQALAETSSTDQLNEVQL